MWTTCFGILVITIDAIIMKQTATDEVIKHGDLCLMRDVASTIISYTPVNCEDVRFAKSLNRSGTMLLVLHVILLLAVYAIRSHKHDVEQSVFMCAYSVWMVSACVCAVTLSQTVPRLLESASGMALLAWFGVWLLPGALLALIIGAACLGYIACFMVLTFAVFVVCMFGLELLRCALDSGVQCDKEVKEFWVAVLNIFM